MKFLLRLLAFLVLVAAPSAMFANTMADVVKAEIVLGKVMQVITKYQKYIVTLEAPKPKKNARGKFLLPYTKDGELTEWATKTFNVQLGAMAGEKAGEAAGKALGSRVPFGGLARGFMKKKGKEAGALAALGGKKFVKKTSSMSFNNLDDYAVYLHVTHGNEAGLQRALAAAMAIYPDLEQRYDVAINKAYRRSLSRRK